MKAYKIIIFSVK